MADNELTYAKLKEQMERLNQIMGDRSKLVKEFTCCHRTWLDLALLLPAFQMISSPTDVLNFIGIPVREREHLPYGWLAGANHEGHLLWIANLVQGYVIPMDMNFKSFSEVQ